MSVGHIITVGLATLIGVLAGVAGAVFLALLGWATQTRTATPALVLGLPVAGFALGYAYWRWGGLANRGTNHVIDHANTLAQRVPARMMPFVLVGTVITHLFGGSAGREGTAVQMGASLADSVRRLVRVQHPDQRRTLIQAGISGGFGAVFGTPLAATVFALEVLHIGRARYAALLPCLLAALIGDLTARALGATHTLYPQSPALALDPLMLLKVAAAGVMFGGCVRGFVAILHGLKKLFGRIAWPPLRPLIGGVAVIGLTALVGSDAYLGLGLPLLQDSLTGGEVPALAFALKLVFTAVTLGSGFVGGEVTPLFVMGATLGHALGAPLGLDPALLASIGMVAVFAGASKTPLACTLMAVELFGGGAALYVWVGCVMAYVAAGRHGIYPAQRNTSDDVKV